MRILSNDYQSNLPNSNKISLGGTANFSSLLSDFLIKNNHEWIGLLVKSSDIEKKPALTALKNGRAFAEMDMSRQKFRKAISSTEHLILKEFFKEEINAVADLIQAADPDLIFLNGAYFNPWLILQAGAKAQKPIIAVHAGIWKRELEYARHAFTGAALKDFMNLEKDFSRLTVFEIFLNDRCRTIYQNEVFQVPNGKTAIIALPVLSSHSNPKKKTKNKNGGDKKIGLVARWDKIKNHEAVLALAKQCKKLRLPWNFYCVTAIPETDVNKKFKDEYREFITVEPPRNRQKLNEFYQKMDLTILPSHFESASYVAVESVFNGTPVLISANVGWVEDFESAGAKDWIADFHDIDGVIIKIKSLINRPIPQKLTDALKEKCDPEKCLNQYLAIFEKYKINHPAARPQGIANHYGMPGCHPCGSRDPDS